MLVPVGGRGQVGAVLEAGFRQPPDLAGWPEAGSGWHSKHRDKPADGTYA